MTDDVSSERQRELLAAAMTCELLEPFTEGGESRTYRVAGADLLVTVPTRWPEVAVDPDELTTSAELLTRVAARVSVPVPSVARLLPEVGCCVVRRLPGVRLLDLPPRPGDGRLVAPTLGGLLGELHTWDPAAYADVAPVDDAVPADWRDEAARTADGRATALTRRQRADVERFLAAPPPAPAARPVLSHADLGIEHVLVERGAAGTRVTGVIDWGDAAITDPAYDFGLLLRDLGPAALGSALAAYTRTGADAWGIGERARYYAGCTLVEDLAFGLTQDRAEYVEKSLAGWERTFSP